MFNVLLIAAVSLLAQPQLSRPPAGGGGSAGADAWPVVQLRDREVAINPADGSQRELSKPEHSGLISPDRTACVDVASGNQDRHVIFYHLSVSTLVRDAVGAIQKGETRDLGSYRSPPRVVGWSADSRRVLLTNGGGDDAGLQFVDTQPIKRDAGRAQFTAVDGCTGDIGAAAIGAGDRIAAFVVHERRIKMTRGDLILVSGGKPTPLARNVDIWSLAFSPDGSKLAVGMIGELRIYTTATPDAAPRTISFPDVDERLYAHLAGHLAWRPDGKVLAARITFAGGRLILDPTKEDAGMFGDREVFLFDAAATPIPKPQVLLGPPEARGLAWSPPRTDLPAVGAKPTAPSAPANKR